MASPKRLIRGLLFGIVFGFLLQKGGAAQFHLLIGALLLADFTILKVMMSAVVVGMIGVWALDGRGAVSVSQKPLRYGANVFGGLLFGAGFALSAYCPGTAAAALGQGNFDALGTIVGMVAGSLLYALAAPALKAQPMLMRGPGEIGWHDVLGLRPAPTIAIFCIGLILVIAGLDALPEWTG